MSIAGLLTQKPDSPDPVAGTTARFTVEVKPKKSGEGTWNKLKNERDGFGESYKILKADRIDDYTHPQHGTFHQFSLLIAPQEDAAGAVGEASSNGVSAPAAASDREEYKKAEIKRLDDRSAEINRAVAFKGAVEIIAAATPANGSEPVPEKCAQHIAALTEALLPIVKGNPTEQPTTTPDGGELTDDSGKTVPF